MRQHPSKRRFQSSSPQGLAQDVPTPLLNCPNNRSLLLQDRLPAHLELVGHLDTANAWTGLPGKTCASTPHLSANASEQASGAFSTVTLLRFSCDMSSRRSLGNSLAAAVRHGKLACASMHAGHIHGNSRTAKTFHALSAVCVGPRMAAARR